MITPDWVRMMARYGSWQNAWMIEAITGLDDAEVRRDRGAFFGSILGTANHLLWADEVWLSRFGVGDMPPGGAAETPSYMPDAAAWADRRATVDATLIAWADGVDDVSGDIAWWSGIMGREVRKPRAVIYTHLFNHQTHHRGQIHAMLTAAGVRTPDTDLIFMPEGI